MTTYTLLLTKSSSVEDLYLETTGTNAVNNPYICSENKSQALSSDQLLISLFGSLFLEKHSEAFHTMLATEDILRRDWDDPEEDEVWADL